MGRRHKKADNGKTGSRQTVALLPRHQASSSGPARPFENVNPELALPSSRTVKLSYRQLGYFQGRKVWETGRSFFYYQ